MRSLGRDGVWLGVMLLSVTADAQTLKLNGPHPAPSRRGIPLSEVLVTFQETGGLGVTERELVLRADGNGQVIKRFPMAGTRPDTLDLEYDPQSLVELIQHLLRERFFELPERVGNIEIPSIWVSDNLLLKSSGVEDCGSTSITLAIDSRTRTLTTCRAPGVAPNWFEGFCRRITAFADSARPANR